MIAVSEKRSNAHSNKKTFFWKTFNKFYYKTLSSIKVLHFLTWNFKKESTNFDRLHLQELKREVTGRNGGNESNILFIFGSP